MLTYAVILLTALFCPHSAFAAGEEYQIANQTGWTYLYTNTEDTKKFWVFDSHYGRGLRTDGLTVSITNLKGFLAELKLKGKPNVSQAASGVNGWGYEFFEYEKKCAIELRELTPWKIKVYESDRKFNIDSDLDLQSFFFTSNPSLILNEIKKHSTAPRLNRLGIIFPAEEIELAKKIASALGADVKIVDDPSKTILKFTFVQKGTKFEFEFVPDTVDSSTDQIENYIQKHGVQEGISHFFNETQFKAANTLATQLGAPYRASFYTKEGMKFKYASGDGLNYQELNTSDPASVLKKVADSGKKYKISNGKVVVDMSQLTTSPCNEYLTKIAPAKVTILK